VRDRRWDFLYDRQKQPVREYVLDRFGEALAEELGAWPPPFVDWVSEDLQRRWEAGLRERPRDEVVRLALELARLDLRRDFEAVERRLAEEGGRTLRTGEETAACHLLLRFLTEKCLGLKEHAERLRLSRDDLVSALDRVEKRLFRVTLSR
jgi:hypothetical protein